MPVNVKKPISFFNRTKYFEPSKDKVRITVSSPASYKSKCSKTDGYEARLYWHYKYLETVDGQAFYYTLTYNDASIPKYFGMNVFDYEDLRDLLTGGFRKRLLREYGTIFKYFIGAELGEGKGSRGMHNNPHYHVLFFLEPDPKCQFEYVKITPEDFRHLVKMYWQGFDETRDGFRDYRTAKYGIAREGLNCGLVMSFAACVYCAKYVTKDAALKMFESKVSYFLRERARESLRHDETFFRDFFRTVIYEKFNIPASADLSKWSMSDHELLMAHFGDKFQWAVDLYGTTEVLVRFHEFACFEFIKKYDLWNEFREFRKQRLDEIVAVGVSEYRNRYCNKPRISHGVGDYVLEQLLDKDEPLLPIPSKDGVKYRPLSLYYYRKLFTQVISPIEPGCKVGEKPKRLSPIRIINPAGVNYRLKMLERNIQRVSDKAMCNLRLLEHDSELYARIRESNINTDVFLSFESVQSLIKQYLYGNETNQSACVAAFRDYAIFKLVYEGRFFSTSRSELFCSGSLRSLDFRSDYERFLIPSYYSVSRDDLRLSRFVEDGCMGYLPYSEHPYFLRYRSFFSLLSLLADYFSCQNDNYNEKASEERRKIKKLHDKRRLKAYYSKFI